MKLLFGKPVADEILGRLKSDIFSLPKKPGLAVILIGNDEASKIYVDLKEKSAQEIGIYFEKHLFSGEVSEAEILEKIKTLNANEKIHGIIVQLPLPEKFNTQKIIDAIEQKKDVDGFSTHSGNLTEGLLPVFPQAIIKLIESSQQEIVGKDAVVIANSEIFGQTMCAMLAQKKLNCEYVLSSDISSNLGKISQADVVVSAVGSPGLLQGQMLKEGAIVIDGGIEKVEGKVLGDVNFASTEGKRGFLSPVPGGVGPVTIACLLENVYLAFEAQQRENDN